MNELRHKKEFERVLKDYQVSESGKKVLAEVRLVAMLAPSGSERNTIIRELMETGSYHFIVSDTTRKPRVNDGVLERNGVEYWFRSEEEVLADLEAGKFLEAEIHHKKYVSGISMRELEKARDQHSIAITDMDLIGVLNVAQASPNAVPILILPPSFKEWQRRLRGRGEIEPAEFRNRLETACRNFKASLDHHFHIVINDDLKEAAEQVNQLAQTDDIDAAQEEKGRQLARELYDETERYLKSL